MRPCQHCGSALESHAANCPQCDTRQVESVGLKAPDPGPQKETTHQSNLVNDSRLITYPLFACYLTVGLCTWWASGSLGLGLGVLIAIAMYMITR